VKAGEAGWGNGGGLASAAIGAGRTPFVVRAGTAIDTTWSNEPTMWAHRQGPPPCGN